MPSSSSAMKPTKSYNTANGSAASGTAADQTISAVSLDSEANWVRAEAAPTNDDIFVAAETKESLCMPCAGTARAIPGETASSQPQRLRTKTRKAIDLAFERASGNAFLIWGDDSKNLKYRSSRPAGRPKPQPIRVSTTMFTGWRRTTIRAPAPAKLPSAWLRRHHLRVRGLERFQLGDAARGHHGPQK